jgi:hypothetical protein
LAARWVVRSPGEKRTNPRYAQALGRTGQFLLLGGPVGVAGLLGLLVVLFPSLEAPGPASVLLFVVAPLGFVSSVFLAFRMIYRGKQYAARARAAAAQADGRAPVLYFRPFDVDETVGGLFRRALRTGGISPWFFSVEEQLADAVAPLGPLVAIGKPEESLPTPGAARRYLADAEWRGAVQAWLTTAQLIVLRPGMSQGLWWELEETVGARRPERLLILVLRMKRKDYLGFAGLVDERLGIRLPGFEAVSRWRRASGFFAFDAKWCPRFLPLRFPFLRGEPHTALRAAFNHALRPIFARLGADWHLSPLSKVKLMAIGLGVLGLALFGLSFLIR